MTAVDNSQLRAINRMLRAAGQSPISSLSGELTSDVLDAVQILDEVSEEVQVIGWKFNIENKYPLTQDINGMIALPPDLLTFDTHDRHLTSIGSQIYNTRLHSFIIGKNIVADITFKRAIEDLPQSARNYITLRAARKFAVMMLADKDIYGFTADDEKQALAILKVAEEKSQDCNMLEGMDYRRDYDAN